MRPAFTVGDKVVTNFGRGQIVQIVQRLNRNWTHAEYYLVKVERYDIPHLFSAFELRTRYIVGTW